MGSWQVSRRHPNLVALLIFTATICGIYFQVLTGHRSLQTNNPVHPGPFFVADPLAGGPITVPLERLASLSWAHLHLPIIDPFQGYGTPLLPNQGVPVYLPQLLAHALVPSNYSVWNVLNLIAIAFGAYLLARSFGQRWLGAMSVGTAAALAGVAPPNLNVAMLNPFALLPFTLLAVRYTVDPASKHRLAACLGVATTVSLLCLSGFQEVLPLLALVIGVYTVALVWHFQTVRVRPRLILATALSAIAGVIIGSIGLVPLLSAVHSGSTSNTTHSYLTHVPLAWLSTLTIPSVAGQSMTGAPQDLHQTVWTLGSPLLVPVVVLAIALAIRRDGRHLRWYLWPSVALVVFGLLGYADVLHVLNIFDISLLNKIFTVRFLQFAWWIPWCLLLGAVISNARRLRWGDAVMALLITATADALAVRQYREALVSQHVTHYASDAYGATVLAVSIACVFAVVVLLSRRVHSRVGSGIMAAVVLGSCLWYLPTNFFPASSDTAVSAWGVPRSHPRSGNYLAFVGATQLPTTFYSVQNWGPASPKAYQATMKQVFDPAETLDGYGALPPMAPALGFVAVNDRFVGVLRSLGVNALILPTPLPEAIFGVVPRCGSAASRTYAHDLCSTGPSMSVGGPFHRQAFSYRVLGASPLVASVARLVAVGSTDKGLGAFSDHLSPSSPALPTSAYVTSSIRHLMPARGVVGISRSATSQAASFVVGSRSAGLAVLRATFVTGMDASVNGRSVPAFPVDGGLWTAVPVVRGTSHVVLNYASLTDLVEFALAGVGTLILLAAWVGLGAISIRGRIRLKREAMMDRRRAALQL